MKNGYIVVTLIAALLLVAGKIYVDNYVPHPTYVIYRTPDDALNALLDGLAKSDLNKVKSVTTSDVYDIFQHWNTGPEWKNDCLYIHSKNWKLKNSDSIWPILKVWAQAQRKGKHSWHPWLSMSTEEVCPELGGTGADLTPIFAKDRNESWVVSEVMSSACQ